VRAKVEVRGKAPGCWRRVVNNPFLNIGRLLMGGGMGRLKTSPLINRNVHNGSACPHPLEHAPGHEFWRLGTGNEDRSNDQISVGDFLANRHPIGNECGDVTLRNVVKIT